MEVGVLHPTASPDLENQWLQPVPGGYEYTMASLTRRLSGDTEGFSV